MKHGSSTRRGLRVASLAVAFGLSAGSAVGAEGINPHADEILRSMSKFLGSAKAFSVSADIGNEIITDAGQKLQLNSHASLLVERPSRFQVARQGRFADVVMTYDGASLTVHGKALNGYVQRQLSGSIDDAIREIERGSGLIMPGADLLLSDSYSALTGQVTSSGYYGTGYIGGVEVHHLGFRTPTVDWQIWVKAGEQPLPMKYVITTKWLTGAPQYSVQLSNWNLKPAIASDQFRFVAPAGATRLEALPVDETGEITVKQEGK